MPGLKILFSAVQSVSLDEVLPMVRSLGISAISVFGGLGEQMPPPHFRRLASEFEHINVNLIPKPTYLGEGGWRKTKKGLQEKHSRP